MEYKSRGYAGDRLRTTPSYTMTNRTKSYKGKEPHALAVREGVTLDPMIFQTTVKTLTWMWYHVGMGEGL